MTTWTTPVHGNPTSAVWNAQVVDNLTFLWHGGPPLWLPTPSQDLTGTPKVHGPRNAALCVPVINYDEMTVNSMSYRSDTANGKVDLGVYLDDGNGTTCSKVSTTGLTAMPGGAGTKNVGLLQPAVLTPFTKYWLVIGFAITRSGSGGNYGTVLGTSGPHVLQCKRATNVMPLPTVITFDTVQVATAPCLAAFP